MAASVRPDSPRSPGAIALLQASHTFLQSLYDPEDNHYLSLDELCAPGILFFTAWLDERTIGTAALALRQGYAEVKSMYVDPAARGQGAAGALLERLIAEGRSRRLPALKLETGPLNTEALALYRRQRPAGGPPVHHPRPEDPPAGHRPVRQRPAAGGGRAEEPGRPQC